MWLYLCRVAMIILQLHDLVSNYLYKLCLNKSNFSFLSFTSWMFHSERSVCILLLIESNFICNCTHNLIWYSWCFICILYTSINICRFLLADSLVKKKYQCCVWNCTHVGKTLFFWNDWFYKQLGNSPDLNSAENLDTIMKINFENVLLNLPKKQKPSWYRLVCEICEILKELKVNPCLKTSLKQGWISWRLLMVISKNILIRDWVGAF